MRIVVDSSTLIDYLLAAARRPEIGTVIEAEDAELNVPALCDVEVVSALVGLIRGRRISLERAGEALDDYLALPLERHAHEPLLRRVLSLRDNFSAYDATYVVLAEGLGAHLLTTDEGLARAVRAHTAVSTLTPPARQARA